ncbi:hypothetical protein Aperf_G00000057350 [Anoplocephala perfoliata]
MWIRSQEDPALVERALTYSTLAVFCAESAEKTSLALANRSIMLYGVGLIDEAICDAKEAVKVGFCSSRCAEDAIKPNCRSQIKLNGHSYDCQGLLPCIRLESFFTGPVDVINNSEIAQLAYACIANTDPQRLLDYVCSVGEYKDGRGHQAFLGSRHVRAVAPTTFDPSDYASIAWLAACSDKQEIKNLFQYTITAVFLTYCLFAAKINSFKIYELVAQNASFSKIKYETCGNALYPTLSLINHSCNPSALLIMSGRGIGGLITLRPLKEGSEISITYQRHYFDETLIDRRYFLQSHYLFDCKCEACKGSWPCRKKKLKKLVCPDCGSEFPATNSTCSHCSSTYGPECYRKILQEYLPKMKACLDNGCVDSEVLKTSTEALNLAQSIIPPPADTLEQVVTFYRNLWFFKYGLWTVEPWLSC